MPWTRRSGYGFTGPTAGAWSRRRSPRRSTAPILQQSRPRGPPGSPAQGRPAAGGTPGPRPVLLHAQASRLPLHDHPRRHDVRGEAALDHPEIRGGLGIQPTELHARDGLAGDLDGRQAPLRADAGVRLEARHGKSEPVGRGSPRDELADAIHVEHEAPASLEAPRVEVLGPEETGLLADAQHQLDIAVRNARLAQDPDGLQDGHDPGLVVTAPPR